MSRFGLELSEYPRVVILTMCERIIVEAETGKRSLIGLFDRITVQKCPVNFIGMNIYVGMIRGTLDVEHISALHPPIVGEPLIASVIQLGGWAEGYGQFELRVPVVTLPTDG